MKDRQPTIAGRYKLINPNDPTDYEYKVLEAADEPSEQGTPLNKALFDHVIAAVGTTAGTATALTLAGDGGFALVDGATIRFKLHVTSGAEPTINVNGTGAKALKVPDGDYMPETAAGTWCVATYSTTLGFFVLASSGAKKKRYTPWLLDALLGYSPLYEYLEASI